MSKFEKRMTQRELEILGHVFLVDLGRDEIPFLLQDLSRKVAQAEAKLADVASPQERMEALLREQKACFKEAINGILQDETASDRLFQWDDSALLHSDIYTYLVGEYGQMMAEHREYSPERLLME